MYVFLYRFLFTIFLTQPFVQTVAHEQNNHRKRQSRDDDGGFIEYVTKCLYYQRATSVLHRGYLR